MPSTKGITHQDVLKVFDTAEPTRVAGKEVALLTTREVADALGITPEAARYHLNQMLDDGAVGRKETGGNGAVWWANVAPRPADSEDDISYADETVGHEDLKDELGVE